MTDLPSARQLVRHAPNTPCKDSVVLSHQDRVLRVRALTTVQDETFIVDLPARTSLEGHFGFELDDGRVIQIVYADEPLIEVRGDLTRYAWHLGALRMHCQISDDRLVVQHSADVETLLTCLGATFETVNEPFTPEMPIQISHNHAHHSDMPEPSGNDVPAEIPPEHNPDGPF